MITSFIILNFYFLCFNYLVRDIFCLVNNQIHLKIKYLTQVNMNLGIKGYQFASALITQI